MMTSKLFYTLAIILAIPFVIITEVGLFIPYMIGVGFSIILGIEAEKQENEY